MSGTGPAPTSGAPGGVAARPLRATYRVQLTKDFGFAAARAIVPYLARLGISHLYASPVLAARPGSTHGYDVVDPLRASPELGGEDALRSLVDALHAQGMGLILDVVPNHMGTGEHNAYWDDVLAKGRASRYAAWFDVDWDVPDARLEGRILLPVLGDTLDTVLEKGELSVVRAGAGWRLKYYDATFPVAAGSIEEGADPTTLDATGLAELIDRQHYRLAFWRRAAAALDYRRFFDINDLVALRQEDPAVFGATHARILEWVADGTLDGIRIDHIDGLKDPLGYLERLRAEVGRRLGPDAAARFPIFVEKIISPGERLRGEWPVEGTTGYEALNDLEALFMDPAGVRAIERAYRRSVGLPEGGDGFPELAHAGKLEILRGPLAPDVGRLVRQAATLGLRDASGAAIAEDDVREAVVALIAALPVYRTYVDGRRAPPPDEDLALIDRMLERMLARAPRRDGPVADAARAICDVLRLAPDGAGKGRPADALDFALRFQQTSGPATAKGVEDTALYRYVPLASRNEVGGDPGEPADDPVERLHAANAERAARWPRALVCTTTHDTKRSADTRARLDVLSELPDEWAAAVGRWRAMNARHLGSAGGGAAPDPNTEYLVYQTILGVWPAGSAPGPLPDEEALAGIRDRVREYALKAAREAKARTSWTDPDEAFEGALGAFVEALLDPARSEAFLGHLAGVAARVARHGAWNSAARTLVHLTAPGTPDIYRGDEALLLALVDPDNRRPVDFDARRAELEAVERALAGPREERAGWLREIAATPEDGRLKTYILRCALEMRRRAPDLYGAGTYSPLAIEGAARHAFAFARTSGARASVTVVARLTLASGVTESAAAPAQHPVWGIVHSRDNSRLRLPVVGRGPNDAWVDALTGRRVTPGPDGRLDVAVADILHDLPVALLTGGL